MSTIARVLRPAQRTIAGGRKFLDVGQMKTNNVHAEQVRVGQDLRFSFQKLKSNAWNNAAWAFGAFNLFTIPLFTYSMAEKPAWRIREDA